MDHDIADVVGKTWPLVWEYSPSLFGHDPAICICVGSHDPAFNWSIDFLVNIFVFR